VSDGANPSKRRRVTAPAVDAGRGESPAGLTLELSAEDAIDLRDICRAYEFLPIHRKVGASAERLASRLRETVDADPRIVASVSAAPS
jgi:hypothetical protein